MGWSVLFSLLAVLILLAIAALVAYNYVSGLYAKYYEPLSLALNLLTAASRFVRGLEGGVAEIAGAIASALTRFRPWLQEELGNLSTLLRGKLENLRTLSGEALSAANAALNEKISSIFAQEGGKLKVLLEQLDDYLRQTLTKGRDFLQETALAQKLSKWLAPS